MSDDERFRSAFRRYDSDNSGTITKHEIRHALKELHLPDSEDDVKTLLKQMDANNDGVVSFEEFKAHCKKKEREVKALFQSMDTDKSGFLTAPVSIMNSNVRSRHFVSTMSNGAG